MIVIAAIIAAKDSRSRIKLMVAESSQLGRKKWNPSKRHTDKLDTSNSHVNGFLEGVMGIVLGNISGGHRGNRRVR